MIRAIVCLCFIAAPALGATWGPALKTKFGANPLGFGRNSFIAHPLTKSEAVDKGYIQVERPASPPGLEKLELWCPRYDFTVCVFLDDTQYIAGKQIAVDERQVSNDIYNWTVQGYTKWDTIEDHRLKTFWTTAVYFISASTLATDPAIRIRNRDQATILQDGAIWVSHFNGDLLRISTDVSELKDPSNPFTEQACIPLMGLHYYYNMTTETACREDTLAPWFPLVQSNQLIGLGLIIYGKHNLPSGRKDYFEHPGKTAVQAIVPRGPPCLYELTENPTIFTQHTYFINHPYLVNCLLQ